MPSERKATLRGNAGRNAKRAPAPASAPAHAEALRSWRGTVDSGEGERVDKFVAEIAGILSRSQIKARDARFFVNGKEEKSSRKVKSGDEIEVRWTDEPSHSLEPERLEVTILYEDANVFVFDKAQGMVTHPAAGNWRGTLANAALWLDADRKGGSQLVRGGIVHRLDKDTSGVIIIARNVTTHEFLSAQFKSRATRKEYWAITQGWPLNDSGKIENSLGRDKRDRKKFASVETGGKHALTEYKVLQRWETGTGNRYALVALYPKTGRTHQLRVHLSELRCPILGDPIYGRKDQLFPAATLMLHARRLKIRIAPSAEPVVFKAATPARFRETATRLQVLSKRK